MPPFSLRLIDPGQREVFLAVQTNLLFIYHVECDRSSVNNWDYVAVRGSRQLIPRNNDPRPLDATLLYWVVSASYHPPQCSFWCPELGFADPFS